MIPIKNKKFPYAFQGWYFKQQTAEESFAVIAAIHEEKASIQIITKEASYVFDFNEDYEMITHKKSLPRVRIGNNYFSHYGFTLNIEKGEVQVRARIKYYNSHIPKHSMMGPLKHVHCTPCIHEVFHISNIAVGKFAIKNGTTKYRCNLDYGKGYIEGDKGNSFPNKYLWTHCSFADDNLKSITTAVAGLSIGIGQKLALLDFTGCTCMFIYKNKEYHIATYLGAKIRILKEDLVLIQQGNLHLEIIVVNPGTSNTLKAPVNGVMERTIVESVSATIRYRLLNRNKVVFDVVGNNAGYECEL